MADITPININKRRLAYWWAGYQCTLDYDDECLTWTQERFPDRIVRKTPLWRVLPEVVVDRSVPPNLRTTGRHAGFLFMAAVIVDFSDIQGHVPLLAPALLLIAGWYFAALFKAVSKYEKRPFEASKFVTEYGEELAAIPQHHHFREERIAFEEQLLEKVRAARTQRG